jgi:protein tyrosine/serine phosphatase
MAQRVKYILGMVIAVGIVAVPWFYAEHRKGERRNLRVVDPGRLYRSGQLSQRELEKVIREHDIRTVVTFRYADDGEVVPPDAAEEAYCRSRGIGYHRVQPLRWWSLGGTPPADRSVREFLSVVRDPEAWPVLVHCYAGVHRTGAYCAVYRMECNNWTPEEALREMVSCGYDDLDAEWDVLSYLRHYRPGQTDQ